MDAIHFFCPRGAVTPEMLTAAYQYGLDRTPRPANLNWDDASSILTLYLPGRESIHLSFPWTIPEIGHMLISTGTLDRQNQIPYFLSVELARGLCVAVRNQAADWEIAGLIGSNDFWNTIHEAGRRMHQAACLALHENPPQEEIDALANTSMQLSSRASVMLTQSYVDRILALRESTFRAQQNLNAIQEEESYSAGETSSEESISVLNETPADISESGTAVHSMDAMPPKWIGARLNSSTLEKEVKDLFLETFNIVSLDISWGKIVTDPEELDNFQKQVDWCYSNGFYLSAGPLLNFSAPRIPSFIQKYRGDFSAICMHVREHVEKVVKRFRNKIKTWIATSHVNTHFSLGLNPIQQLELTARIMSWIREFHPTAKISTSVDQPWGDGLLPTPTGVIEMLDFQLTPTTCAEILLRSRLGLSSLILDFNVGYRNRATYDRPLVEWSRMIDNWSQFKLPLYLSVRFPSSCEPDPKAFISSPPVWEGFSQRQQNYWAATVLPLVLAKPQVHGIYWGDFRDYCPHDYANAGLISRDGKIKKALRTVADIQQKFNFDDF